MNLQPRVLMFFSSIAMLAVMLAGCNTSSSQAAAKPPVMTVPVTVATVVEKTVPLEYRGIGNVEPFSKVEIRTQVTGTLEAVHFKEGGDVKQGQRLFTLDRRQWEANLAKSQANLVRDQASAANARSQATRAEKLFKEGVMAREQFDQLVASADAADAAAEADKAAVNTSKLDLAYTEVSAPISGRTGNLMVHAGNVVKVNDTVLTTINQVMPVYVTFSVPEAFLDQVRQFAGKSKKLPVLAMPQDAIHQESGALSFIDNAVDTQTGTIKLKGIFPNQNHALWPGEFVDVVLTLSQESNRLVVPSQAVQTGQAGTFVYVVTNNQTVETRPVKVLRTNEKEAILSEGVQNGETVVTDGQLMLFPGAPVVVKKAGETQPAAKPGA